MSTLQNMWKKAENLVQHEGNVLKVPWSSDIRSRLVKSSSSEQPHVVKANPRNVRQYLCDDKCPCSKDSHCVLILLLLLMISLTDAPFWSTILRATSLL